MTNAFKPLLRQTEEDVEAMFATENRGPEGPTAGLTCTLQNEDLAQLFGMRFAAAAARDESILNMIKDYLEEEVMPLIVKERLAEYKDKLRPQIVTIINLGTAAEEKVKALEDQNAHLMQLQLQLELHNTALQQQLLMAHFAGGAWAFKGAPQPAEAPADVPAAAWEPAEAIADVQAAVPQPAQAFAEATAAVPQPAQAPVEATAAVAQPVQVPVDAIAAVPQPAQAPAEAIAAVPQPAQAPSEAIAAVPQPVQSPVDAIAAAVQPAQPLQRSPSLHSRLRQHNASIQLHVHAGEAPAPGTPPANAHTTLGNPSFDLQVYAGKASKSAAAGSRTHKKTVFGAFFTRKVAGKTANAAARQPGGAKKARWAAAALRAANHTFSNNTPAVTCTLDSPAAEPPAAGPSTSSAASAQPQLQRKKTSWLGKLKANVLGCFAPAQGVTKP